MRPARPGDGESLQRIEVAAGAAFAGVGLSDIAAAEPPSTDHLATYALAGRSWVAADAQENVVAYVIVDVIDACAHVEQISVHPDCQGRGVGRRLLDEVERWAVGRGLAALTLTTFADVSWNAPLYAHLGFVALSEQDLGPGLTALREEEARHGLDPAVRICMRREVRLET